MTARMIMILGCCLATASCDRQTDVPTENGALAAPEQSAPPREGMTEARRGAKAVSIMRPSVIDEVQPVEDEPAPTLPAVTTITFASSGVMLDAAQLTILDKLVASQAGLPAGQVILRGHSDTRGSDGDNLVASRRRAEAVRDALVDRGVAEDDVRVIAFGETRPVAPNSKPDGTDWPEARARNRRVEIEFTPAAHIEDGEPAGPNVEPDASDR